MLPSSSHSGIRKFEWVPSSKTIFNINSEIQCIPITFTVQSIDRLFSIKFRKNLCGKINSGSCVFDGICKHTECIVLNIKQKKFFFSLAHGIIWLFFGVEHNEVPSAGRAQESVRKLRTDTTTVQSHRQRTYPRNKDVPPNTKDRRYGCCEKRRIGRQLQDKTRHVFYCHCVSQVLMKLFL